MVEHRLEGFWPGTLVGVYDVAAQDARRERRDPPSGPPIATACADALGVAIATVPEGPLLAYGTRIDGRAGWIRSVARRSAPPPSEPERSEPEPEFGRPQSPPEPRKPSFTVGARGADLSRRR